MRAVCAALCFSLLTAFPAMAGDKVIARVGKEPITQAEIQNAQAQNSDLTRQQVFESLVERRLILSWALQNGMTVSEGEIDTLQRSLMESNNLTAEQFMEAIKTRGETPETFRESLREQILINRAIGVGLRDQMSTSDEEIEKVYQERFPPRESFKLSHILVKVDEGATETETEAAKTLAADIHTKLKDGASFNDMVRQHSQDVSSKDSGGSLGTFAEGELIPELEKAVLPLATGEFSSPVKTAAGYHIVLLESRDTKDPPPLSTVRDQIRNFLMGQKEAVAKVQWLKELREMFYIEIFRDDL
jgi:parvulin-like peptidyl-prolyl isomerase